MNRILQLRIVSALVAAPLLLAAVVGLDSRWFGMLAAIVMARAAFEWADLGGLSSGARLLFSAAVVVAVAVLTWFPSGRAAVVAAGAAFWLAVAVRIIAARSLPKRVEPAVVVTVGLLVLVPAAVAVVWLHDRDGGAVLVIGLLLIVWAADTGAYVVGRAWGSHRLAPLLSPGKTVEGLAGGAFAAFLVALLIGGLVDRSRPFPTAWIALAALTVPAAVIGDLFESRAKRIAGVKDSGTLMPGHGGLLDRIDSLLAAAPVFACGVLLLE